MHLSSFYLFVDCNGTLEVKNPEEHKEKFNISLKMIIMLATGMPEEPPIGFQPKPSLVFHSQSNFPTANTCVN